MNNSPSFFNLVKQLEVFALIAILLVSGTVLAEAKAPKNYLKNKNVLVFTKNGKGFVHDNVPFAVASLEKLALEYKFRITVTDDPNYFTEDNLQSIDLMVFPSTNNEVFTNNDQRLAFKRYIQAGGGLVGLHSVIGTERNWEWFKMLIGGTFVGHPKYQKLAINKIDKGHPSMLGIPNIWVKEDECYLMKELYPGAKVLMAHDLTSLNGEQHEMVMEKTAPFHKYYPAVWHQDFDGGFAWITALGHNKKDYEDPIFLKHIYQGMNYIASRISKKDYSKAYANAWDSPVDFK
ncbi:ThuA domain-containing protein [uncultured Cyclobacterium sp.]|mgnify:CR=1 FL=1|uniref:ThuA domain-containing protein n=1 Tax=uncultured Cyclobacterium sp. TaxID=453820 RepID=UPI0030EBC83C|tara:strand:+ start:584964 stop:585836 length:873 start_codon:yes stop_codon:yes gene_type:complete